MAEKKKSLLLAALAAVGALIVSAAVLYGLERSARTRIVDALIYRDSELPALRFEPIPGARGELEGVPVHLNGRGLRDREIPVARPPAVKKRIVVLGDSITFARGVPPESAFPKKWEQFLGPSYEVINAGVCAYNGEQELAFFDVRLADLKPDLVVLALTPDDFEDVPPTRFHFPRLKNFLRERSAFARSLMERSYRKRFARSTVPSGLAYAASPVRAPKSGARKVAGEKPVDVRDAILARARGLLEKAGKLAETRQLRLVVLYVPRLDRINTDPADVERREALRRSSAELRRPFWDAFDALTAGLITENLLDLQNPYLSEKGHATLAQFIADRARREGIL
ncbi:MAG TPA: hypothetical protein P5079_08325 [Elusimicrobiota bacterium]|nr:hypothetical protein [Elusimicrobiota bacterium]